MNDASLPIHVQMLMALRLEVQQRQRKHETRVGEGIEDREYQRHVGRIAECKVQIEAINEMMKADLDEVADYLENNDRDNERSQRPAKGDRGGKRRPASAADHR